MLYWKNDPQITATVYSDRTVLYEGEEVSLSPLTSKLKGFSYYISPTTHWLYKDRLLSEIYDETYPMDE